MIKRWRQFNESMAEKPGPNVPGSVKITMSAEEASSFSDEPALSKLIYDDKISLLGNDIWYLESDAQTKGILDTYLEMSGENKLEEVTEGISSDLNKDTTLHIIKLHIEDELKEIYNKTTLVFKTNGREIKKANNYLSDSEVNHLEGKREAYKNVLNMISRFEK